MGEREGRKRRERGRWIDKKKGQEKNNNYVIIQQSCDIFLCTCKWSFPRSLSR